MFEGKLHENLERDIKHIESEVSRIKENQVEGLDKRDVVKESFRSIPEEIHYSESNETSNANHFNSSGLLPDYVEESGTDEDTKLIIEKLLDMVFHKGIFRTLKASKKYPSFIQDAFHDALVDKLIPELEKRGVLK
ncbi:MAG: hypothetical protein WD471_00360 [Candidatus Paceibacterota bacterium]